MRRPSHSIVWSFALACVALACVALAAPPGEAAPAEPGGPGYRVIVNPDVPVQSLERRQLADIFLKKSTRWSGGDAIKVVDLAADSRARVRFTEDVIGRSVASVKSYWQQMIFAGRGLPPPELADDALVVAYVLKHAGAIGYVSGTCDIGLARVVSVR